MYKPGYQFIILTAVTSSKQTFINKIRQHLLDNLDDKPANETERALMKKIQLSLLFFILTHRVSPVSGPMHRLTIVQQAFSSTWYMHNATAAD